MPDFSHLLFLFTFGKVSHRKVKVRVIPFFRATSYIKEKEKYHLYRYMEIQKTQRLELLDALRGFDLFFIVAVEHVINQLFNAINAPWANELRWYFDHVAWQGFSPWDLIMPLFLFMAGVSMPFAFSKYKNNPDKKAVYRRIVKRFILLWIFGMMCQGNLLGLAPATKLYLYSNTLQAIATGYLIAAMLFLHINIRKQVGVTVLLLLLYWCAMQFISFGGYGGGNYTPEGNLAEGIDRYVLGRFRDMSTLLNGQVVFDPNYHYTWILSSLNFGATVMTGIFAGAILKNKMTSKEYKLRFLFLGGLGMVAAGWLWNFQMPVIKHIWTSSMVLVSSGYCFLLMGLFYYLIDYKGYKKNITWLKVYGMNSITAYMLALCINFSSIGESLLYGTEQYLGSFYPTLIATFNAAMIYFILHYMYKKQIFLKV